MRIILVRHGEPNYELDCLTDTGKRQAAAAAERLAREGISEVYSSPNGRARETAGFTADKLGLPVTVLDFMHEITWGGEGVPEEGHPWTLSERMMAEGFDCLTENWREHPYYKNNLAVPAYDYVSACFDKFIADMGLRHEGIRYYCGKETDKTIAVFSHGGSGACVLARLLDLPFPWVITVMPYDFTSIIILEFPYQPGEYVRPRLELFNDIAHIRGCSNGPKFQQKPDER